MLKVARVAASANALPYIGSRQVIEQIMYLLFLKRAGRAGSSLNFLCELHCLPMGIEAKPSVIAK